MTDRDDETRAWSPPFEDGDETQVVAGDPTGAIREPDEATRRMPAPAGAAEAPTSKVEVPRAAEPATTRRLERHTADAAPMTERIAVPDASRSLATGLIATIVVVALVLGGIFGYQQREPSDANVVARALVGPSGGVMSFDQIGKLTVPSGALPTPTAITIRRETIGERVRLGAEGQPGSVTYEPGELVVYAFEPPDLRFQQPVTVELPRTGDASAVFVDARGSPRVVPGNPSGNIVRITTTSFSFEEVTSG